MVVAEFMKEEVQELVGTRLSFRPLDQDVVLSRFVHDAEWIKDISMLRKELRVCFCPEIAIPRVNCDDAACFVHTIGSAAVPVSGRENDRINPGQELLPVREQIDEGM